MADEKRKPGKAGQEPTSAGASDEGRRAVELGARAAELRAATARANQEADRAHREFLAAQRERSEMEIDRALAALNRDGFRYTPAMRKVGLREVLIHLRDSAATVKLAHAGGSRDRPIYEVILDVLRAIPTVAVGRELAPPGADGELVSLGSMPRDPEVRAVHARAGLTADRVAELRTKFPSSFEPHE